MEPSPSKSLLKTHRRKASMSTNDTNSKNKKLKSLPIAQKPDDIRIHPSTSNEEILRIPVKLKIDKPVNNQIKEYFGNNMPQIIPNPPRGRPSVRHVAGRSFIRKNDLCQISLHNSKEVLQSEESMSKRTINKIKKQMNERSLQQHVVYYNQAVNNIALNNLSYQISIGNSEPIMCITDTTANKSGLPSMDILTELNLLLANNLLIQQSISNLYTNGLNTDQSVEFHNMKKLSQSSNGVGSNDKNGLNTDQDVQMHNIKDSSQSSSLVESNDKKCLNTDQFVQFHNMKNLSQSSNGVESKELILPQQSIIDTARPTINQNDANQTSTIKKEELILDSEMPLLNHLDYSFDMTYFSNAPPGFPTSPISHPPIDNTINISDTEDVQELTQALFDILNGNDDVMQGSGISNADSDSVSQSTNANVFGEDSNSNQNITNGHQINSPMSDDSFNEMPVSPDEAENLCMEWLDSLHQDNYEEPLKTTNETNCDITK